MAGDAIGGALPLWRRLGLWTASLESRGSMWAITLALLPFTILALLPVGWHPNEEYTYLTAHMSVRGESAAPYAAVFDQTQARFLFNTVAGWAVELLGYDATQVSARILMAGLYAAALGYLFNALGLSALRALATVALFYILGQTIFGDDWLFDATESKTFAYGAVIFALGLGLKARWYWGALSIVLATYLHFLVGGFWALAFFLLAYLRHVPISQIIRVAGSYFALVAPLVVVVLLDQVGNAIEIAPGDPDPNVVYAMRNAHHIAPFASLSLTLIWVSGVVEALFLIGLMTLIVRNAADRTMAVFCLFLLAYFFVASGIAFLDRNTHLVAKFYLFRPNSLILLLTLATALATLESWLPKKLFNSRTRFFQAAVLLAFGVIIGMKVYDAIAFRTLPGEDELAAVVHRESAPDEIVLIEPGLERKQPYVGLGRRLERPTLVSRKFIPTNPKDIDRWTELLDFRERLFDEGCEGPLPYPIRLIVAFDEKFHDRIESCGTRVWQRGSIIVVRVPDHLMVKTPVAGE